MNRLQLREKVMRLPGVASLVRGLLIAATLYACGAQAQQMAQARFDVNLRAGPNREFPVVGAFPAGTVFAVLGCLGDFSWCDVQSPPFRGWIYAENLFINQPNGNQAALNVAGAVIGIGVTSFILNSYWREHYYNRPWYGQVNYWNSRPVPYYGHPGYHRPPGYHPPPPAYRPPPPPAYRPPPPGYHRPPPPPPGYHHPPPAQHRPPPPQVNRPPPQVNRPPPPPPGARPQPR